MTMSESLQTALKLRSLIESEAELVEQNSTMTPKVVDPRVGEMRDFACLVVPARILRLWLTVLVLRSST